MGPVYKPEHYEFLYEKSSRNRILVTAKTLFASLGYDNTSTAVIARNAGTSESQLMKHFGGKAGLLEAIFTEGWDKIVAQLEPCFEAAADSRGRVSCIQTVVFAHFEQDLELKTLILLEAHRMRETARVSPEKSGYARFVSILDRELMRAQGEGTISNGLPLLTLRSAITGVIEGGLRDQVLATRANFPADYDTDQYQQIFSGFVSNLLYGTTERRTLTA